MYRDIYMYVCVCVSLSLSMYIYIYIHTYTHTCFFFFFLTRRVFHSNTSCGCSGGEGTPPETLKCLTRHPYSDIGRD